MKPKSPETKLRASIFDRIEVIGIGVDDDMCKRIKDRLVDDVAGKLSKPVKARKPRKG